MRGCLQPCVGACSHDLHQHSCLQCAKVPTHTRQENRNADARYPGCVRGTVERTAQACGKHKLHS
jgi:hypothetical protein